MLSAYENGEIQFPNIAGDFAYVHLTDVFLQINHNLVDKSVRNPALGKKAPIILAKGTLAGYGNAMKEPVGSGWKSVTYNPHKHPEYVENPKGVPTNWWHDYEKYQGFHPSASRVAGGVERRIRDMQSVASHPEQPVAVTRKNTQGYSNASASEAIFHQHNFTPREYMWVRGLRIEESRATLGFISLFQ